MSQDSLLVLQKKILYKTISFSVNNIGEVFLIDENDQLKKIDSKGDSIGVYNEIGKYGKLSYVESRDPWKTVLFYKDFSTLILLDKYLNELTNINLRKKNYFGVKVVASSYDGNFWMFDEEDETLKKIDQQGSLLLETTDFRKIFDNSPSPTILKDREGGVYLYDSSKGLYIFDYYGTFKSKLTLLNWRDFEVLGNMIYGFDSQYLYTYQKGTLKLNKYLLPTSILPYSAVQVASNKIYFLHDGNIQVFELKK